MENTIVHVCLNTDGAPAADSEHELGERWVCECGSNYVFREGFSRAGYQSVEWWAAPAVPQPRNAKPRRGLLFGPRKG